MENRYYDRNAPTAADLTEELQQTRLALANAYDRFNFVSDPELVDASIYEINSLKAKYNYLFRKLKEQEAPCVAAGAMEGGSVCQS
jgi:hypothetical protein